MHKAFYVSGFIFRTNSQQILLHQPRVEASTSSQWSLLSGMSQAGEAAEKTFHRIATELLKVKLDSKRIFPVYDYFHKGFNAPHFVFYAEVSDEHPVSAKKGTTISWFSIKQTLKFPFSPQTKQDILVAERVIKAQARIEEAKLGNSPEVSPQK